MGTLFDMPSGVVNEAPVLDAGVSATAYGKVAEQLAIAELLSRGRKVFVPVADDDGVDLMVDYRWRVQVKNAMRGVRRVGPAAYRERYGYQAMAWSSKRCWTEADVFLLHAHGEWFVVPAAALAGRGTTLQVYFGGRPHRRETVANVLERYRDAWWVFDGEQGLSA